ncbi:hypothetical protein JCM3765_006127 [Sporobolomyces pararoseus]
MTGTSSAAQSVPSKPSSFSFVTEPADPKRFLDDLPLRPFTPEEAGTEDSTNPSLINSSASLRSTALFHSTSTSMNPTRTVARMDGLEYSPSSPVSSTTASSFSPNLRPPNSPSGTSSSTRSQRSGSKSRNRLSATLTGLLSKSRSRSASKGAVEDRGIDSRSASSTMSNGGGEGPRRMSTSSARRNSIDRSTESGSTSPSPSPPLSNGVTVDSSSNRSKPPVSLPSLFRRRPSASSVTSPTYSSDGPAPRTSLDGTRRSFDRPRASTTTTGLGLSSSSLASSDGGVLSDVSTAATSPDLDTADVTTPRALGESLSSAEKRRRSSLVLARELDARTEEEEDLSDFVRASGTTSPSPNLNSGPFARRPSSTNSLSAPPKVPPESSQFSPTQASSSTLTEPTEGGIAARRQTRNIENLNLGDLGRRSPAPSASTTTDRSIYSTTTQSSGPSQLASISVPPADPSTRPRSTTQARLQALPRLLSMDAIPNYGPPGEDEEQEPDEETESDNEDGDEGETTADATSDDEGDRYASADEAPVVSRNTTPAQTPRPASRQTSIDRFASASTSSPSASQPAGPPRLPSLTGLSSPSLNGGRPASSWITFAPLTPGTVRTARPQPSSTESAGQSYFDLPRPSGSTSRTPGGVPQTPLAPMSISDVARGKRPALQEQVDENDAAHARTASTPGLVQPAEDEDSTGRHGLYRLRSQSEVALMSPSMVDSDEEPVGTAAITGLDSIWRTGGTQTPGPSFLTKPTSPLKAKTSPQPPLPPITIPQTPGAPPTPQTPATPASPTSTSPTQARLSARPTTGNNRLHRPRSMYELRDAPPAYTSIARQPGFGPRQDVQPREEEGKEGLPQYTCSIHIEGFMPRKMEFTSPGVQAKDRAWKRQYIVLHGTSIKVYKYDLRTHPIPGEDDWSVVPVDIAGKDGPPPLHFHQGEYGVDNSAQGSRFPLSIEDAKAKAKSRIIQQATASSTNLLLRHYSLQNAESGLAADYIKRKHVVRVRAEGEQFLLQAKDDRGVIDLIEALQAATNVALDLDARPLPKFITLPRRRRRRRPRPDAAAANGAAANGTSSTATDPATSTSNAEATPPPERERRSPDRFAEMADEDRALASGNDATLI